MEGVNVRSSDSTADFVLGDVLVLEGVCDIHVWVRGDGDEKICE